MLFEWNNTFNLKEKQIFVQIRNTPAKQHISDLRVLERTFFSHSTKKIPKNNTLRDSAAQIRWHYLQTCASTRAYIQFT